ncbi:MAG: UDP-N-acetylmuramoyl-L-alanine--D-glutamate ligase [Ignavibacteria bacterium]|nr:UDP-N-acetylmuramoyl-L-alanine--D-glutamate ligase [Ignavibacteria bacterium]
MNKPAVRGKRFSVIGGGRSGLAVAGLLKKHGGELFLSEAVPADRKQAEKTALEKLGVESEFGAHTSRVLDADTIVLSPGVPATIPVVMEAVSKAIPVVSEIEVAGWFCRAPIIAVTGTNGKTTTTTLIGRILSDAGMKVAVGGNIGVAFSEIVESIDHDGVAVVEISSFQLDTIQTFRPGVSVLLNITPDHLDRYGGSFDAYMRSKGRIMMNQRKGDIVVYNSDDPATTECVDRALPEGVRRLAFGLNDVAGDGAFVRDGSIMVSEGGAATELMPAAQLGIRGAHNLMNAMASILAVKPLAVAARSLRKTLATFAGVEHRLEQVRVLNGATYVNDSKATNVDSVWHALQSFSSPIILILGGRDKGNDYSKLNDLVTRNVRMIVAIGESAGNVVRAFSGTVPVLRAGSMHEAVVLSSGKATVGDVVLLSPACASFDWFENYEERGRAFKNEVRAL